VAVTSKVEVQELRIGRRRCCVVLYNTDVHSHEYRPAHMSSCYSSPER